MKTLFNKLGEFLTIQPSNSYLIVGLGNPGSKYKKNRHNVGFMILDEIANRLDVKFSRVQSNALVTKAAYANKNLILAKPQTFMNNSGQAVSSLVRFYKIAQENIIIIFDDADLDWELLRLRPEGGSSGQNGMKSVIQHLGTENFPRLRIGIGRPPGKMKTPAYVLQDFSKQQNETLPFLIDRATEAALMWVKEGIDATMNIYNRKS